MPSSSEPAPADSTRRPGRPRDARADVAILEATWAEVAAYGLAALSLDKVAARAGVSKATIYRRWPSKEALVIDAWRKAEGKAMACPDTGTLRGDLFAMLDELEQHLAHQPLITLLPEIAAATRQSPELEQQFQEFMAEERQPLRTLLERAAARGELRAGVAVETVLQLVVGPFLTTAMLERRALTRAEAEAMADALLHGIGTAPAPVAKKRTTRSRG